MILGCATFHPMKATVAKLQFVTKIAAESSQRIVGLLHVLAIARHVGKTLRLWSSPALKPQ